jgi:hypothetical protein
MPVNSVEWLAIQRKIAEDNADHAAKILDKKREIIMVSKFKSETGTPIEVPEYVMPFLDVEKLEAPPDKNQGFPNGRDDNEDRLNATSPGSSSPKGNYKETDMETEKETLRRLVDKYKLRVLNDRNGETYYSLGI